MTQRWSQENGWKDLLQNIIFFSAEIWVQRWVVSDSQNTFNNSNNSTFMD